MNRHCQGKIMTKPSETSPLGKLNTRWLFTAVLSAAVFTGCGGGNTTAAVPAPDIAQSVAAVVSYINGLIAGTSETGDPVGINALTLAVDDTAEPSAIN
jgi:hypothetical protein